MFQTTFLCRIILDCIMDITFVKLDIRAILTYNIPLIINLLPQISDQEVGRCLKLSVLGVYISIQDA